jgi:uncharacterized membrane protein YkvA (DUF1232 family)
MENAPKDIEKYQDNYSQEGFWDKLRKMAKKAGRKVVYNALLLYYVLADKNTPTKYKAIIVGALGYFILPIDLIPDLLPGVGFADDLAAIMAVVMTVQECITPEIKQKAEEKSREFLG